MSNDIQTTLRNMAVSEWADVYDHRDFLFSVSNRLAFLEAACTGMRKENDALAAWIAGANAAIQDIFDWYEDDNNDDRGGYALTALGDFLASHDSSGNVATK